MQTPKTVLDTVKTRGDFRALNEPKLHDRQRSSVSGEVDPTHPIWDAWKAIKQMWPGPCTHWEPEPPTAWLFAVQDLNTEKIGNGVRNLIHFESRNGSKAFPPSASEFRDLCLTNFDWERRCHKPADIPLQIEDQAAKQARRDTGLSELAKIRQKTGL